MGAKQEEQKKKENATFWNHSKNGLAFPFFMLFSVFRRFWNSPYMYECESVSVCETTSHNVHIAHVCVRIFRCWLVILYGYMYRFYEFRLSFWEKKNEKKKSYSIFCKIRAQQTLNCIAEIKTKRFYCSQHGLSTNEEDNSRRPTTHNTNRSDDNSIDDKRRRFSCEMLHLDNAIVIVAVAVVACSLVVCMYAAYSFGVHFSPSLFLCIIIIISVSVSKSSDYMENKRNENSILFT